MTSCINPNAGSSYVVSSAADLNLPPFSSSFVRRNGSELELDGRPFTAIGPNIYWLGLDENVQPSPSYPSRVRVNEILATAAGMGSTAVRAHTLGISVATSLSVESSLGVFNEKAFEAIDYALYAARQYGLRLIIPLTDQYDYYHGSIYSFLRWRNLSASSPDDFGPFYDRSSPVYNDFTQYITRLLTHRSNITGLTMAEDPVVMALETGNELGGFTGKLGPPPVQWVSSIATLLKQLAPNTLVLSGTYGVKKDELDIANVDIYSNHFYPLYSSKLSQATLAQKHDKAFIAGEYDWTNRYYLPLLYLTVLAPVLLAALIWILPSRWWPWRIPLCCGRRTKRRRQAVDLVPLSSSTNLNHPDEAYERVGADSPEPKSANRSFSTFDVPVLDTRSLPTKIQTEARPGCFVRRWHVSLFFLILCPILAVLIHVYLPQPLAKFTAALAERSSASPPSSAGEFYWSLFGRDDQCCQWVPHDDGYTLHYTGSEDGRIRTLVERAYSARGESARYPRIACPQQTLTLPTNST